MGHDPLLNQGLDLAIWIILIVKTVAIFAIVMLSVLFMVVFERKSVSWLGNRVGPNRAGPRGYLQSLADGTKLFMKEAFTPVQADKLVFKLAPYLALIPAFVAFSIVPIGSHIEIAHHVIALQLADPSWGILLMLMTSGIGVYGVFLAGWSSGSKYPLLGSVRASAQMISYEAALGLSIVAVVLVTGSLHTSAIVASQHHGVLFFNHWNVIRLGFIPFFIFLVAVTAEMSRPPFDLVEAEEELAGGYLMEYSSIGFAFFYLAEYMNLVTNSAIVVTLFFGGPDGPRIFGHSIGVIWFMAKVLFFLYLYVWIRATLPRLRYDQLMDLGWKGLIPISLGWLLVIAGFRVDTTWGFAVAAGCLVAGALMLRAIDVGSRAARAESVPLPLPGDGPADAEVSQ
jgi:NADH-quinone oxidoreductase subunit H